MEKLTAYKDVDRATTTSTSSAPTRPTRRSNADTLKTRPWTVAVEGEVKKPESFDIDELLKLSAAWKSASTACAASRAGRW